MPTPIEQHPDLIELRHRSSGRCRSVVFAVLGLQGRVRAAHTTGDVVRGCNIESASYGLSQCAERTALFAAAATGQRDIPVLAVACPGVDAAAAAADPGSVMPCGACRQVMSELLAPDALVVVVNVGVFTMDELLPHAFRLN